MTVASRFQVAADDLRRYDWSAVLAQVGVKDCHHFYTGFIRALEERQKAGDDLGVRVYRLLAAVASFHPNYDAAGNPYGPMRVDTDGTRSLMAEDLTKDDLAALHGIAGEIAEPEFRARVADVVWECGRDFKAAHAAVRAFHDAAQQHKTDDLWPPYAERMERAVDLAARLGFGQPLHLEMLGYIETAIAEYEKKPKSELLPHRLMDIAFEHQTTKATEYAALAARLAGDMAAAGNWHAAERYWQQAARWHRRLKNEGESKRCLLAAAECFVSIGEGFLTGPQASAGGASHWFSRAVAALRQIQAEPKRIAAVHRRLLELQRQALGEMGAMDIKLEEIPGFLDAEKQTQEAAAAHVRGHPTWEAIGRLAHITKPTDAAALRAQLKEQSKEFIWDKIVGTSKLDASGKVADIRPATGFGAEEDGPMRQKMCEQAAQTHWPIQVGWKIEPARRVIIREHALRVGDLGFLVEHNPLIPPGHEMIILRGLQAGFFGDWLVAMHLLVPQVEGMVRQVLQQNGVITSNLAADLTQEEKDLNQLLWMPEAEQAFGPDILFDLRAILIERFGHNLRNESAHAMIAAPRFYQAASVYFWWLMLWLCWRGYRFGQQQIDEDEAEPTAPESPKPS